jgi:response regulator NasT
MYKVLLMIEGAHDETLGASLTELGYAIVSEVSDARQLRTEVARAAPEVIIVRAEAPTDELLENIAAVSAVLPRPVVVFAREGSREVIRRAVECGVAAYVVEGWAPERITPIIEAATARFEAFDAMRKELLSTRTKLSERKVIEKAKGIVMQQRRLNENDAYGALRKMAMDQNLALAEVARRVIAVSQLLA